MTITNEELETIETRLHMAAMVDANTAKKLVAAVREAREFAGDYYIHAKDWFKEKYPIPWEQK